MEQSQYLFAIQDFSASYILKRTAITPFTDFPRKLLFSYPFKLGDGMAKKIRTFKAIKACADDERTSRSCKIVEYGHESCTALLAAFRTVKGPRAGGATDEQQDILRAMLVMAGACIDSTLKQLFRDCIPILIQSDSGVRSSFNKFVESALKRGRADDALDVKLLAQALGNENPLRYLSSSYVYDLTGSSLQSAEQLYSAADALGIPWKYSINISKSRLKSIFDARNKIVHEMDIDFSAARRNRYQRKIDEMIDDTNELLRIAGLMVTMTQKKLPTNGNKS